MISGRGNSGEKTEPDESRLKKWYCEAISKSTATATFADQCQGSG